MITAAHQNTERVPNEQISARGFQRTTAQNSKSLWATANSRPAKIISPKVSYHAAAAEGLSGRSVLDIGCRKVFRPRSERRGAARVLGIDKADHLVEKNALLCEITGSQMIYAEKTIYDLDPAHDGIFDLVIFLSVFQHLDHPFRAIDVISRVTSTTAIMEPHCRREGKRCEFQSEPYSIMRRSKKGRRIFLPNEPMFFEMLSDAGFTAVDQITRHRARKVPGYGTRFLQERLILHAHKHETSRL